MSDFGDATSGFSTAYEKGSQTLRVTAWGFWSPEVALQFAPAITSEHDKTMCKIVEFDLVRLVPMRDEGQQGWVKLLASLDGHVEQITIATRSKLTKLQLLRLTKAAKKSTIRWIDEMEMKEGP